MLRTNCAGRRSTPDNLEERKNRGNAARPPVLPPPRHEHRHKLRHHGPQQHSLHCVHLSLLPDRMSADSGEELNLMNLHCLQRQPQRRLYLMSCSQSWDTSFTFFIFFFLVNFTIVGSSPVLPSSTFCPLHLTPNRSLLSPSTVPRANSFFTKSVKHRSSKNWDCYSLKSKMIFVVGLTSPCTIFLRIGHSLLLKFLHVQPDAEADELRESLHQILQASFLQELGLAFFK